MYITMISIDMPYDVTALVVACRGYYTNAAIFYSPPYCNFYSVTSTISNPMICIIYSTICALTAINVIIIIGVGLILLRVPW
jgi:hypothetical protein